MLHEPGAAPVASPSALGQTSASGAAAAADTKDLLLDIAELLAPPLGQDELGWLAHYRVLKVLGHGGMGVVFQAEDTHLQRPVALKAILPAFAASAVARERFLREARAAAALRNDHVVTVYQVGQDRDTPYLATELLEGETLEDRLRREGRLSVPEVLRIGQEVADGLAAAHEHGLIHRDIKPANIYLEGPRWRVKILDFGLARATRSHPHLTQTGMVVGTPEYMSPEQARSEEVDARSDLFSLGAVLYALCSGQRPFQGNSLTAVLTALAVDTPRPVRELNPEVPPALAELVESLLAKEPARRPASAHEVRERLQAIESGNAGDTVAKPPLPTSVMPAAPSASAPRPAARFRSAQWLVPAGAVAGLAVLGFVALLGGWFGPGRKADPPGVPGGPPIRVGVLHSRTGTMALSERPVADAVLLAVEEINEQGGLLGRPVEAILADGQSDETVFARQAGKLIQEDRVCTIFGCWTSASRKAVVPVVERHDHLMVYPVQYEGVEQSPNVVYLGPVPNQQILPALRWLVGFEGKRRWFLVGSDYVFPVTANAVIRDEARARGCEVVGEEYLPLGTAEVAGLVGRIKEGRPDLIVNTINGDTNVAFFRALRRAGVAPRDTPTLSFSISEQELSALAPGDTAGDYVAGNYFQSLGTSRNQQFLGRFARRYGAGRVVSSAMETAYTGVHLWAKAVRAAGGDQAPAIREALKDQEYDAPQGPVRVDPGTLHAVQTARVGRVGDAGQLVEVYASPQPVEPRPYPESRGRAEWVSFLNGLHRRWGGRWSNPGQ
jgi:urea transport system substrate-binding protein